MKFRIKDWAIFLACEGLFLVGLSVGIWGSQNFEPSSTAALVFCCGGLLSLIIAGLVWSGFRKPGRTNTTMGSPISLDDSFRAFLRFRGQTPLIRAPQMVTYFLVVSSEGQRLSFGPDKTCIFEHWSGPDISVVTNSTSRRLAAREILRLDCQKTTEIVLRRADNEAVKGEEVRSRFLVHLISGTDTIE
jgi:hypothetical protein